MTQEKKVELLIDNGFRLGRMISGSKSGYHRAFPDNDVVFNANIFTIDGKVWYGDLDLTKDAEILQSIANDLNETIYILRESAGRFGNENISGEAVIKNKYKQFDPKV